MFEVGEIAFGDHVRIVDDDTSRQSGHAGCAGVCYGATTPSATGVDVIGDSRDDVALNVYFEESGTDAWFAPDLVALVDHAEGSTATVGDATFIKGADGSWARVSNPDEAASAKRWFRRSPKGQ